MGTILKHRYIARVTVEAITPLVIGTGDANNITDQVIATDCNGLPYIPGTALAGVLKHSFNSNEQFGNEEQCSRLFFTEGKLVDPAGNVIDGRLDNQNINWDNKYFNTLSNLPIREHVSISDRGIALDTAVFSHQILPKGYRFCFEIELQSNKGSDFENDNKFFNDLLTHIYKNGIRVGSKTRGGYGLLKVVVKEVAEKVVNEGIQYCFLDLTQKNDLLKYIAKSGNLSNTDFWKDIAYKEFKDNNSTLSYEITIYELSPADFFLFSTGLGDKQDEHIDFTPRKEPVIVWENNKLQRIEEQYVIPASSIKGALSHRVAFHYNRLIAPTNQELTTGSENEAVKALFGYSEGSNACAGSVYISDIFISNNSVSKKKMHHVMIDRFTGGATKDGALFSEHVLWGSNCSFELEIIRPKKITSENSDYINKAFDLAIQDLCNGYLPLGGGVNRGNGVFTKKLSDNDNNYR